MCRSFSPFLQPIPHISSEMPEKKPYLSPRNRTFTGTPSLLNPSSPTHGHGHGHLATQAPWSWPGPAPSWLRAGRAPSSCPAAPSGPRSPGSWWWRPRAVGDARDGWMGFLKLGGLMVVQHKSSEKNDLESWKSLQIGPQTQKMKVLIVVCFQFPPWNMLQHMASWGYGPNFKHTPVCFHFSWNKWGYRLTHWEPWNPLVPLSKLGFEVSNFSISICCCYRLS